MGYDTSGAKSISPLQTSRSTMQVSPAREREKTTFMGLLKAIMAVCAADGKILRLQQLTRDACMSEDNFIIALQKICDILGCYRLASNISQDVIMQAVNIYMETSEGGGGGGGGGQGQNAQNYSRLQGLGLRPDTDAYGRGYQPGPGQGNPPMGLGSGPGQGPNGGIPWPGPGPGQGPGPQGGQNGIQMPRGPPSGPGQAQRSSFNFDSVENNPNNRSSFGPGPGQGPGQGLGQPQNVGPNPGYGMRPYSSDTRLNAYGSGSGRGGYPSEITEEVLNNLNMNSAPNSSRSVTGSLTGSGSSAVSFSVPDGNLSARITRASFPAPSTAQHTLQQDMARLQHQQSEFSQAIGANRMPSNINPRIISPRLPLHLGGLEPGVGDRREAEMHSSHVSGLGDGRDGQGQGQGHSMGQGQGQGQTHAQSLGHALQLPLGQGQGQGQGQSHNSQLNVQSSPFYPTLSLPINSANLAVIKNNAAAAAANAAGQQPNTNTTSSATSTSTSAASTNASASAQGCLRTAGLSVITAAKIFWEHSLEIFLSIGNPKGTIEDSFEAIVGKYVTSYHVTLCHALC